MTLIEKYKQGAYSRIRKSWYDVIEEGRELGYLVLPLNINEEYSVRNSLMWYIHLKCGRGFKPITRNAFWTKIQDRAKKRDVFTTEHVCEFCDPERIYRVRKKINDNGFELADPNQIPPFSREYAHYRCLRCGYVTYTTTNSIYTSRRDDYEGCTGCSQNGFKVGEPAYLYVCGLLGGILQKVGVTNNGIKKRYTKSDRDKFSFTQSWFYYNGGDALRDEQFIKHYCRPWQYQGERLLSGVGNSEIFHYNIVALVEQMENGFLQETIIH